VNAEKRTDTSTTMSTFGYGCSATIRNTPVVSSGSTTAIQAKDVPYNNIRLLEPK